MNICIDSTPPFQWGPKQHFLIITGAVALEFFKGGYTGIRKSIDHSDWWYVNLITNYFISSERNSCFICQNGQRSQNAEDVLQRHQVPKTHPSQGDPVQNCQEENIRQRTKTLRT